MLNRTKGQTLPCILDQDGGTGHKFMGADHFFGQKNSPRLAIWLDGADSNSISKDASDMIEKWADKSGNDVNATQTNGSYKPKYIPAYLNNQSVVKFDGSNDKMILEHIPSRPCILY